MLKYLLQILAITLAVTAELTEDGPAYFAVKYNQVDNRTQRTDWGLNLYWTVIQPTDTDPETYLEITTNIKNYKRQFDQEITYKEGHMYQAWI